MPNLPRNDRIDLARAPGLNPEQVLWGQCQLLKDMAALYLGVLAGHVPELLNCNCKQHGAKILHLNSVLLIPQNQFKFFRHKMRAHSTGFMPSPPRSTERAWEAC